VTSAYDDAVRILAKRSLSKREVAEHLRGRGHDDLEIDNAIARLEESRAVDDEALARHWVATRAASRARGRERTVAELAARGVSEATALAAWREAIAEGTIDDGDQLARAVLRRLGPPPGRADRSRLARVYNALLSEGFEREPIEAALAPYGLERTI